MKQLAYLFAGCVTLFATSCSKDDDVSPVIGPKDYQVEYTVRSSTNLVSDYVSYDNESGGTTTLTNVAMPASYKFKRNMKQGDHVSILASIDGGTATSEIIVSILLDGKQVKQAVGRGVDAQAVPVYVIGE